MGIRDDDFYGCLFDDIGGCADLSDLECSDHDVEVRRDPEGRYYVWCCQCQKNLGGVIMWKWIVGIFIILAVWSALSVCNPAVAQDERPENKYFVAVGWYDIAGMPIQQLIGWPTLKEAIEYCNTEPVSEICPIFTVEMVEGIKCKRDEAGAVIKFFHGAEYTF